MGGYLERNPDLVDVRLAIGVQLFELVESYLNASFLSFFSFVFFLLFLPTAVVVFFLCTKL